MRSIFWFLVGLAVILLIGTQTAGASEVVGKLPNIFYVDEMPSGCEMSGGCITWFRNGTIDIHIDNALPPELQQLVLTHELCHFILGPKGGEDVCWDVTYKIAEDMHIYETL